MGEMADMAIEETLTHADMVEAGRYEEAGYRSGHSSVPVVSPLHGPPRTKTCRCCGETGLIWMEHRDRWRLGKLGGGLHDCPVNPLRDTTP